MTDKEKHIDSESAMSSGNVSSDPPDEPRSEPEASPDTEDLSVEFEWAQASPAGADGEDEAHKKARRRAKAPKGNKGRPRKPSEREILARLLEKEQKIAELRKKYSAIERETADLKDKWLRSVAEFENYRKRMQKEWELLKQQSKAEVILEVLNIVDDFERAFSALGEREDDTFVEGVRMIYTNLITALEKSGVQEIEALNKPFDPTYHMAVGQIETEDSEPNHVAEVLQKGYLLGETVLRPARVMIAK